MRKNILLILMTLLQNVVIWGQVSSFNYEFSYTGDAVSNLSGGMRTGTVLAGLADISLIFATEPAGWWRCGEFCLELQNTHGGTPTASFIGDLQGLSNIENGNYTYLYQLWYRQKVGNFAVLAGIHDLNSEFLIGSYALEYINSSLGIMPTVSINVPVSIFPKTSLAVVLQYGFPGKKYMLRGAVYEGDPRDLDTEEYNLDFSWDSDHGNFYIVEAQAVLEGSALLKLGAYYHDGDFTELKNQDKINSNYGFYVIGEKEVWRSGEKSNVGVFVQAGWAPDDRNMNPLYLTTGANFYGLFMPQKGGRAGLCVAYAGISKDLGDEYVANETVIEMFAALDIMPWLTLKQDFQYVINCGGIKTLNNAMVMITRLELAF